MKRIFVLAILLEASCGSHTQTESLDQYATSLQQLTTISAQHRDSIVTAADLQSMMVIERAHREQMAGMATGVMGTLRDMGSCPCCADGRQMMDDLDQDLAAHFAAMSGATSVELARQEEVRHQAMMEGTLDRMMKGAADSRPMMMGR
jgi:hypothetical protein